MEIVNMTPHTLNIKRADGTFLDVPAPTEAEIAANPDLLARCQEYRNAVAVVDGIELYETSYGAPSPLPPVREGTIFVVSSLYLSGLRAAGLDRPDVYVPGKGIRGVGGEMVGCIGLSR